jgi:hypothetical protein
MRDNYVIQKNNDGTISNPYVVNDGDNQYYVEWRQLCSVQVMNAIDPIYVHRITTTLTGALITDIRVSAELKGPYWDEYVYFCDAGGVILPPLFGSCVG